MTRALTRFILEQTGAARRALIGAACALGVSGAALAAAPEGPEILPEKPAAATPEKATPEKPVADKPVTDKPAAPAPDKPVTAAPEKPPEKPLDFASVLAEMRSAVSQVSTLRQRADKSGDKLKEACLYERLRAMAQAVDSAQVAQVAWEGAVARLILD